MATNTATARLSDKAVKPLRTLDPTAPLDDLTWLDDTIGDARVVAIGESAHYNGESYQLRHRLLRYLVERHGFSAYAMETGFTEGWRADNWVRGSKDTTDQLGDVMANGMTSLMGLWTPMRAHLEWMRQHNRSAARPVGFYGIDLGGSNVSLLPGLDAAIAYLAEADPEFQVDPSLREPVAAFAVASAFSAPAALAAYRNLAPASKDALTAGLVDLVERMTGRRLEYVRRTTVDPYQRALRSLRLTIALDGLARAMARGDRQAAMFNRDAAIADTVEWILGLEDRIVLAAHNGHIQRWPGTWPGMPPATPMGMHLADRLGDGYLVVGITNGTGQTLNTGADFYTGTLFTDLEPPEAASLDALMAASHDGPFATDLRLLSPADAAAVRAVHQQRYGNFYADLSPLDAYDIVVHLPQVTAAEPDADALAHAPREVREPFARWGG
ncbi:MAG TPA: erythromycin esterase family protein [Pseudonocardiaceae bacterium]|nr:erythromycin esterase family protein [Pseudonocardiaceae bacterium]